MTGAFNKIWEELKAELFLSDEDLDVAYKIQISNGIAILGYLGRGKVKTHATGYPHPSAAKRAAESYVAKHPEHKYKILPWERLIDSVVR